MLTRFSNVAEAFPSYDWDKFLSLELCTIIDLSEKAAETIENKMKFLGLLHDKKIKGSTPKVEKKELTDKQKLKAKNRLEEYMTNGGK